MQGDMHLAKRDWVVMARIEAMTTSLSVLTAKLSLEETGKNRHRHQMPQETECVCVCVEHARVSRDEKASRGNCNYPLPWLVGGTLAKGPASLVSKLPFEPNSCSFSSKCGGRTKEHPAPTPPLHHTFATVREGGRGCRILHPTPYTCYFAISIILHSPSLRRKRRDERRVAGGRSILRKFSSYQRWSWWLSGYFGSPLTKANLVQSLAGPLPDLHIVGIVPDDSAGQRVFSGFSRFPRPCIPTLLNYAYLVHTAILQVLLSFLPMSGIVLNFHDGRLRNNKTGAPVQPIRAYRKTSRSLYFPILSQRSWPFGLTTLRPSTRQGRGIMSSRRKETRIKAIVGQILSPNLAHPHRTQIRGRRGELLLGAREVVLCLPGSRGRGAICCECTELRQREGIFFNLDEGLSPAAAESTLSPQSLQLLADITAQRQPALLQYGYLHLIPDPLTHLPSAVLNVRFLVSFLDMKSFATSSRSNAAATSLWICRRFTEFNLSCPIIDASVLSLLRPEKDLSVVAVDVGIVITIFKTLKSSKSKTFLPEIIDYVFYFLDRFTFILQQIMKHSSVKEKAIRGALACTPPSLVPPSPCQGVLVCTYSHFWFFRHLPGALMCPPSCLQHSSFVAFQGALFKKFLPWKGAGSNSWTWWSQAQYLIPLGYQGMHSSKVFKRSDTYVYVYAGETIYLPIYLQLDKHVQDCLPYKKCFKDCTTSISDSPNLRSWCKARRRAAAATIATAAITDTTSSPSIDEGESAHNRWPHVVDRIKSPTQHHHQQFVVTCYSHSRRTTVTILDGDIWWCYPNAIPGFQRVEYWLGDPRYEDAVKDIEACDGVNHSRLYYALVPAYNPSIMNAKSKSRFYFMDRIQCTGETCAVYNMRLGISLPCSTDELFESNKVLRFSEECDGEMHKLLPDEEADTVSFFKQTTICCSLPCEVKASSPDEDGEGQCFEQSNIM
ncbi:hypothetical protein PR048_018248 [Dryococelus australis]|uniref:Uncharacterized protein n=1 Tax=Dryococelus australis TaxID=614101 RepID=A0ABQ9HBQ2_9NEOP|nr:hypothetical protein PR048_018248 [Dryococelus australis]